jgi:hypothetical protein
MIGRSGHRVIKDLYRSSSLIQRSELADLPSG